MKLLKKSLSVILALILAAVSMPFSVSAAEGDGEIALYRGWRQAATSFTFEDNGPSQISDGAPLLEKYGYRGSFYLVTSWNPNWDGFQELADKGHEIGSHSASHPNNVGSSDSEIRDSKATIESKIIGNKCITLAYPNGNVGNEEEMAKYYIAGRTYNGSWQGASDVMSKDGPSDWFKVYSVMVGTEGKKTTNEITALMLTAINDNGWVTFALNGFQGKNNGNATYSPTNIDVFEEVLAWAKENDSNLWVAPLRDVAMYIKERKASIVTKTSGNNSSVTYTLTHSIADDVCDYDYPLSVRVPKPEGWNSFIVKQNGKKLEAEVKDDGKIYFDAVPNGGDIRIVNTDISSWQVLNIENKTYTGKAITQSVTVTNGTEAADVDIAYAENVNAGTATMTITGTGDYTGSQVKTFVINKADNPVKVKVAAKPLKLKKIKKKKQTVKAIKVTKAQGKVTYKLKSVPKPLKKLTKINSKGVITINKWKKAKKGTYKIKVIITAKGNANYKPKTVTKTVKIKVK